MEHKSNSYKVNRQQREKVLRYSIRKYSFGAASVAVAALMFLGARVASADSVSENTAPSAAGVVSPKDEPKSPQGIAEPTENKVDAGKNSSENQALTSAVNDAPTVDKAKLKKVVEELNSLLSTKLNLDDSVVSPVKDRLQKGKEALESSELAQKDIDELVELLSKDVTVVSAAKEVTEVQVDKQADKTEKPADNLASQTFPEVSANEESQTVSAKKDTLKVSVDQLQAAVLELPEHETSKEVLEKANELLGLARGVLENTTVSLNDVEDMTKRVKRMFNSVKNATTRLTSGARDSRNGQSIPRGTQFRAYTPISSSGALKNVKYFASLDSRVDGQDKRNDDPEFTENKTVIKSSYEQDSSGKWMVYDIFFNNDGKSIVDQAYGQHYYFQPPFNIMDGSNTVKNLTITRYRNVGGRRLSDGGSGFQKVGNTVTISNPWTQKPHIFDGDRRSLYDPNSGVSRANQQPQVFKNNAFDPFLDQVVRKTDGSYTGGVSYTLGLEVGKVNTPLAVHMTARVKLKDNVTETEAANGNVYAASVNAAPNGKRSYVVGSRGTSLAPRDTTPPTITANGATVTKNEKIVDIPVTAEDNKGGVGMRPNNPIEVTGLPQGLTFTNGKITGTPTGPVGNSTVTIKAYDKNGNKAEKTITITVKDQASKYNPTGDTLTVNQGQTITDDAVKAKVKNYAPGSLTVVSKPSTAKPGNVGNAVVKVTYPDGSSENVNVPVTVLEAPDNQPPTLAISPANQTVVEGEKVTFTVTAKDNKVVTIDGKDFTTKYGNRLLSGKATNTNVKITDTEKVTKITITTSKEDVGKTNTITFNASDNAGNKAKPVTFTFNVTPRDTQKPEATLNGVRLTENANTPIFTVYRGATFNPELKVWDNSGVISKVEVKGGLPKGVTASTFTAQTGKTEKTPYATRLSSGTVLNTETLGEHEATLHVEGSSATDSRDLKFKYRVVDIETRNLENGITKVPVASTLNVANSGKNIDAHRYLKVVDSEDKADRGNNYLPSGMTWTWKQGDKLDPGTTLDNSGKYTRNATAVFPDTSKNSITDVNSTTRTTFAPAEIKRQVVLAVTPTVPSIVGNEDGSVTITPPTRPNSTNPQDIDTITLTYVPTGKTTPETVIVTKSGNTWTATVNGKTTDKVSVTPAGVVTISDAEVADKTEVTAKVSKRIDNNLTLESPVARGTANGPLAAEVTPPAPVTEKAPITPVTVVTPNKPGSTITTETPVNGLTVDGDGNLTGTPTVTDWGKDEEERKIIIPVKVKKGNEEVVVNVPVTIQRDTDGDGIPDKVDPDDDNDGIPDEEEITNGTDPKVANGLTGTVTGKTVPEKTPVPANTKVVTPNKPGTTITVDNPVNGLTVDNGGNLVGTPTVTDWGPKEEERTVEIPVKLKRGTEEVVVKVPVKIQRDTDGDGIPDVTDPDDDNDGIPDKDEENNGTDPKTPTTQTPTIEITQQPNGNAIVTPKKPDGTTYPPGTKVEIPGEDGTTITVTIGDNGSGEVPNDKLPKKAVPGTGTVTEPNKNPSKPVDVTTPARKTPTLEVEQDPKTGDVTVTPKKPDGSTYPPGTKVEIPGKDGNPITVTIGEDGKGKVPNSELPDGKVPGTGKITEPGKSTEEVPNVETPSKIIPGAPTTEQPVEIEIIQKPNGDAIVTPKKPDGSPYPPGTKVEIPGEDKDGNPITITVTIGDNGSGEVPNDKLPKKAVPGTGTVTEPNKNPSKPVDVTTPARKTPTLEVEQDPKTGDVTVTPKRPGGGTYPPGTKVEIPGKDGNSIIVTIGEDGKGKVPNSELPDGKVPGTGKITEPGKSTEEVPNVETPARKTPTLEVEQDPKTGDVTVTPKKPDGSTYPPGTKVEIPGKDGNPITVTIGEDGKGTVPNSELPEGKVPGTGKITEPGKPAVEVPNVTTPAKFTPETPVTEKPGKIEITQQPSGNAIVTPKKPDGSTYPPGTKVEIPGENGTTITVTIGDNGSGEVPNDKLPKGNVPGTGRVTEPNKKPSQPVDVTTPARKTPTVELEQDPKTGDVTVTPKKPDGSTYPPGTKVEIPGKDGNSIIVTIGEDGKGKVPNSELPEGKVPGTAKITEPGQPTVEVPDVTTPGKVTPPTDTNPVAPVTPDTPVKPDTNGGSGQDTPAPATPTPNADQVDTKTTVDNGAKSNGSQNVLPNTGTESNAALASLGLLGLLSGFGLVARKKKED
ncbi:YSIRK signal domain/LPXTG anchor domain surface protein [Streptococcus mitis]|uniref:Gram positive anchor n=1 Tax=Streptococcus mitis SK1073 TaxID=1008452 RepID=F9HDJ0_STRMT|nr:YSIRK signal domain/LPXTG anchor domain surface protein [Streptococcus mitis]EGP65453.1 gram positive anchor [Streptococcus mitis SK1073]